MFIKGAKNGVEVEFTNEEKPAAVIFNKIGNYSPEGKRWWITSSDSVIIDSHTISNNVHSVTGRIELHEMDMVKNITMAPSKKSFMLSFRDTKDSFGKPDIEIDRLDLE